MALGWIRSYDNERTAVRAGDRRIGWRERQARFRESYRAPVFADRDATQPAGQLAWGTSVELPHGLESSRVTEVRLDGEARFVMSADVVEIAFVKLNESARKFGRHVMEVPLRDGGKRKQELLWGDTVQILRKNGEEIEIMARGLRGTIDADHLHEETLLEVYFVDVGQGDGVLVRTPDLRHLLIDGGLERRKQQSGKSGADFVDWKFFKDYGDFRVRLDSMMASHSDNDHYGGLHDLIRDTKAADRELDCTGCDIVEVHHPGLSRWEGRSNAVPEHLEGLGPEQDGFFLRLLEDRGDTEGAIVNGAEHELSGPWKWYFRDVLDNDSETKVTRVGVDAETVKSGAALPFLWDDSENYSIVVLAPVTTEINGTPALKALRYDGEISRSKNTNGHSICLRVDYRDARILLTGDLNKASMDWLAENFVNRMDDWACDVAKACHHGSHDISVSFLEKVNAATTVISSGDAEGHAHPRPEVVGASAVTGRASIDPETDRLVTPLIYMTEVERSVSIGAVNRIDFRNLPTEGGTASGILLGRHLDELNDRAFLGPEQRDSHEQAAKDIDNSNMTSKQKTAARARDLKERSRSEKDKIDDLRLEEKMLEGASQAVFNLTVPTGPVASRNEERRVWRSRVVEKLHYGLVNVRTDGKTVMCATLDETEDDWIVHRFEAEAGRSP